MEDGKKDFSTVIEVVGSIRIASFLVPKETLFDGYFCQLFECEQSRIVSRKNIAEMLGKDLFEKYEKFTSDKEKTVTLGEVFAARHAHTQSPEDIRLFERFMERCQSPEVVRHTGPILDYFERVDTIRGIVFQEKEKRRLGYAHPDNPVGRIFWEINMKLTKELIAEMDERKRST